VEREKGLYIPSNGLGLPQYRRKGTHSKVGIPFNKPPLIIQKEAVPDLWHLKRNHVYLGGKLKKSQRAEPTKGAIV